MENKKTKTPQENKMLAREESPHLTESSHMGGRHVRDDCRTKPESQMTQISCIYNPESIDYNRLRATGMSYLQNNKAQCDVLGRDSPL